MLGSLALTLVVAMTTTLVAPALPYLAGMSWLDWVWQLRIQLEQIVHVIAHLREALVTSVGGWWREILPQVAHELGLADLAPVLNTLETMMAHLPADLRSWLGALVQRLLAQAAEAPELGSTADSFRTAVTLDPRLREAERHSVARQANAASSLTLSELVQQSSDEIAATLAQSTAGVDATQQALRDADSLHTSVTGAQSSRALLQYLGEGLADLMRQNATMNALVSQHLSALSQQDALSTRDVQIVVSLLVQDVLAQEEARRGQAAASQEALRLLADGYSQSLVAVGSSLVDLQGGSQRRRHQLLDAITPAF